MSIRVRLLILAAALSSLALVSACSDAGGAHPGEPGEFERRGPGPTPDPRIEASELYGIWPQVWSQHAPGVRSWEYKVNCGQAQSHKEPCFLSDLTAVTVEAPGGEVTDLDFDFNTNGYSGEVTRRWVKYGPEDGELPAPGDYVFRYWQGDDIVFEQSVPYRSEPISYPTDVRWERDGNDLVVEWSPPPEAAAGMHYKAIVWEASAETPPVLVSKVLPWDSGSGVLEDVPFIPGGTYSLNLAIYFADGYAYSDYVIFDWTGDVRSAETDGA